MLRNGPFVFPEMDPFTSEFLGHTLFLNFNSTFYLSTEMACQQIQIGWLVDVTNKKKNLSYSFFFL
jgi:hypothetical protein